MRKISPTLGIRGRALKVVALSIATLWLTYLVVGNGLLWSGTIESWVDDSDDLDVSFREPYTLFPGRVHLKDFELRLNDSSVQMLLAFDSATVDVALFELPKRTFHVEKLRGDDMVLRLREKIDDTPSDRRKARYYPPIEGFDGLPLKAPQREDSSDDDESESWVVRLEGIQTTVSEIWVQNLRYVGPGKLSGGYRLHPKRRLRIGPASAQLGPGTLTVGARKPLLADLQGDIRVTVAPHDLDDGQGWAFFRHFSAQGTLRSRVEGSLLAPMIDPATLSVERGRGSLVLKLDIDRGKMHHGSMARYRTQALTLLAPRVRVSGDTRVEAEVKPDGKGTLLLAAEHLELGARGAPDLPAARIEGPQVLMRSNTTDLAEPWNMDRAKLELRGIRVPDFRLLNPLLDTQLFEGGNAKAKVEAEIAPDGSASGRAAIDVTNMKLALDDFTLHMTGKITSGLRQPKANVPNGRLVEPRVKLEHLALVSGEDGTKGGRLQADTNVIPYEDLRPTAIVATVRASFDEAEPVLHALGIAKGGVPGFAAKLLDLSNLQVVADVRRTSDLFEVQVRQASTNAMAARGTWQSRGDRQRAAFLLVSDLLDVGVAKDGDSTDFEMFADEDWLVHRLRELGLDRPGT